MGLPKEQVKLAVGYEGIEKTVKNVMCSLENFSSVSADTNVKSAVYLLKNSTANQIPTTGSNYLLVFENKSLAGFVGIPELLASVQPPNLRDAWYRGWNVSSWIQPTFMKGLFTNLCHDAAEKQVRDIMEPSGSVIGAGSTLEEAAFKLFSEKRDMLPVTENEKLVGVLRACDLFEEMINIIL
ncbi:MAG: CBS domain-containing protein [Desulfocucumaceae bacterium]